MSLKRSSRYYAGGLVFLSLGLRYLDRSLGAVGTEQGDTADERVSSLCRTCTQRLELLPLRGIIPRLCSAAFIDGEADPLNRELLLAVALPGHPQARFPKPG